MPGNGKSVQAIGHQIPISKGDKEIRTSNTKKVNQILAAKKKNPEADTSELEAEIDRLVYELYDLTAEEIAIVEAAVK